MAACSQALSGGQSKRRRNKRKQVRDHIIPEQTVVLQSEKVVLETGEDSHVKSELGASVDIPVNSSNSNLKDPVIAQQTCISNFDNVDNKTKTMPLTDHQSEQVLSNCSGQNKSGDNLNCSGENYCVPILIIVGQIVKIKMLS